VVTVGAQATKLTQPERVVVPSMRHEMISDGRRRDAAGFQAEPAQWLDYELMTAPALPACGAIPAMNFRTVRHRGGSMRAQGVETKRVCSDVCRGGPASQSWSPGLRRAQPGLLHFPKKPFALKATRCELSTAQVLAHTWRVHFSGDHRYSLASERRPDQQ